MWTTWELPIASFAGCGTQEELTALYEAALLVIYWRLDNGLGNVANRAACSYPVIDALANGCALVTNAARGAREYVVESGAAIDLADAPDRLPSVLARLLTSPRDAVMLGERALEYAARKFSTASVASKVAELLPDDLCTRALVTGTETAEGPRGVSSAQGT